MELNTLILTTIIGTILCGVIFTTIGVVSNKINPTGKFYTVYLSTVAILYVAMILFVLIIAMYWVRLVADAFSMTFAILHVGG